jgi:hypothetical protein
VASQARGPPAAGELASTDAAPGRSAQETLNRLQCPHQRPFPRVAQATRYAPAGRRRAPAAFHPYLWAAEATCGAGCQPTSSGRRWAAAHCQKAQKLPSR